MVETIGNYRIEMDNAYAWITPLSSRCKLKLRIVVEYESINSSNLPIPQYIRDYVNKKRRYFGIVYLIHFERPFKHARHYMGFTKNLDARILQHEAGKGSRLMKAVIDEGIAYEVVRTWYGDRYLERTLKRSHNAPRFCPKCNE